MSEDNRASEGCKQMAVAVNVMQVIQDCSTNASVALSEEQNQEMLDAFNKVARPCTMCNKKTANWCNDCETTLQEKLDDGLVVRGRALCNTCEKDYFMCSVCDEEAMWS